MSSIEDAITYPTESDDWIVTVLIGGVMLLLSFLVIPAFIAYGYLVRAIQSNLDGEPEPPTFGDWGELIVDGLKVFVVGLIYMLIPLAVLGFTVGTAIIALLTGSDAGAAAGFGTLMVGLLVGFVLSLIFGYLAVVGIVNFVHKDSFGAAFDVGTIREVGFDSDFAVPWLISVGVFLAAGLVAGVLNIIPFLGGLVGVFLNFYALIVAANLWADGYLAATGGGDGSGQAGVEQTPV
ncbi:DUF4013 domain-containing protein [Natronomonas marina]|jgi:hypothetical protein|uniref:DUF4013 domain-containing protein n=1 Tax=Natronomonas marina TaxID=2961939 RepID=UPI0020C94A2B|nr:DUF4013 domain-containing protein [Natronomonas marina]